MEAERQRCQQSEDQIELVGIEPAVLVVDTLPAIEAGKHIRSPPQDVVRGPNRTLIGLLKRGRDFNKSGPFGMFMTSVTAGLYITLGALLSLFIVVGVPSNGMTRLVQGIGLAAGFVPAVLSGGLIFHDPAALLNATILRTNGFRLIMLWIITWLGNAGGALAISVAIRGGWVLFAPQREALTAYSNEIVSYAEPGRTEDWFACMTNGIIAGAILSLISVGITGARSAAGKIWLIFIVVVATVAVSLEAAVINMGYLSIALVDNKIPGFNWGDAIWWNIVPATVGNVIGTIVLCILFYFYAYVMPAPAGSDSPVAPHHVAGVTEARRLGGEPTPKGAGGRSSPTLKPDMSHQSPAGATRAGAA